MALWISIGLFLIYLANVILGATGSGSFMSDVGEMLVLFAASIAFTVAILKREMQAKSKSENHDS